MPAAMNVGDIVVIEISIEQIHYTCYLIGILVPQDEDGGLAFQYLSNDVQRDAAVMKARAFARNQTVWVATGDGKKSAEPAERMETR